MPKLPIDWEINGGQPFLDFGVGGPFITHLPSSSLLEAAQVDQLFAITETEFASLSSDNFSDLSVRAIYGVAHNWGIEDFRLQGVGEFMSGLVGLARQSPGTKMQDLAEATVIGALDIAFSAIGAIPVFGWAVAGFWQVARGIYRAVQMTREEDAELSLRALGYDGDTDQDHSRRMLAKAETEDWTKVFLPPVRPSDFKATSISWGADKNGKDMGGYYIAPEGKDLGGLGVIPGMPMIVSGYQIPKWYAGDKAGLHDRPYAWLRDPGRCVIHPGSSRAENLCSSVGDWLPSAKQMGLSLWSMVRKNSANAFKIDQDRIVSEWADYFGLLLDYIRWRADRSDYPDNDFQIAFTLQRLSSAAACYPHAGKCVAHGDAKSIKGFVDYLHSISTENPKGIWLPGLDSKGFFGDNWWASRQALVEFFVKDQFRACSQNFVNTITIAYVAPDFPAIRGNSRLARKYEENREKLLRNPAVHDLEADMIPDDYYRSRVKNAQRTITPKITGIPKSPPAIAGIAVPEKAPPYPQPPDIGLSPQPPDIGPPAPRWKTPGLTPGQKAALAIALFGGGYLTYRRYHPELRRLYSRLHRKFAE